MTQPDSKFDMKSSFYFYASQFKYCWIYYIETHDNAFRGKNNVLWTWKKWWVETQWGTGNQICKLKSVHCCGLGALWPALKISRPNISRSSMRYNLLEETAPHRELSLMNKNIIGHIGHLLSTCDYKELTMDSAKY